MSPSPTGPGLTPGAGLGHEIAYAIAPAIAPGLGLPVPRPGPGVCATCRGPARDGHPDCWCCRAVRAALRQGDAARPLVVPAALFRPGDPLHRVLRGYKDAPVAAARRHFAARLGAHLADFLAVHGGCIAGAAGGGFDALATVPSSRRVAGHGCADEVVTAHPLEGVVATVPALAGLARLQVRAVPSRPAARRPGHLAPDPGALVVSGDALGRRVMLVDDAWVTGARMHSAAAALGAAGAEVVAMVVAGRAVDPGARPALARWWSWAEERAGRRPVPCPGHRGQPAPGAPTSPCCLAGCPSLSSSGRATRADG